MPWKGEQDQGCPHQLVTVPRDVPPQDMLCPHPCTLTATPPATELSQQTLLEDLSEAKKPKNIHCCSQK